VTAVTKSIINQLSDGKNALINQTLNYLFFPEYMETQCRKDDNAQQPSYFQSHSFQHINVRVMKSGNKIVEGRQPVSWAMYLWWKMILKHEEYTDAVTTLSKKRRLEVINEEEALVIHTSDKADVGRIPKILQYVRQKFPQIRVDRVSTLGKNIGLDAYLQELQKHIDVVFNIEPGSNLLHFCWNQNKHPHIHDEVKYVLDTLNKNTGCQFQPFARPECVGKMVQDERFKNKCEAYACCEVRFSVQQYRNDKNTIVTAMVHQQASGSVEEVFRFIDVQTQVGKTEVNDLKYVSRHDFGIEKLRQVLTKIFGTEGPVFWDIECGGRQVAFCCVDEKPTSDEIKYIIKIAPNLLIVKQTTSDNISKDFVIQKLNALGKNLISVVQDSKETDNAIDILVYCRNKDGKEVEQQIKTILSQDTGSERTTDKSQAPGQPQAKATKPTQTATSSTLQRSSK